MADYIYTMEIRLTPDQQRGVTLVQDIARDAGMNIYLTGGAVRDIISGFAIPFSFRGQGGFGFLLARDGHHVTVTTGRARDPDVADRQRHRVHGRPTDVHGDGHGRGRVHDRDLAVQSRALL